MSEVADRQVDQRAVAPNTESEGLDRGVGFLGLLWASEGSIIGSGWLFGALTAASIAGPSAIIAWIVASFIVILLALVHAELGGLFPVSGGTSRFPHYAFGSFAGGDVRVDLLPAGRQRRTDRGAGGDPVPVDRQLGVELVQQ